MFRGWNKCAIPDRRANEKASRAFGHVRYGFDFRSQGGVVFGTILSGFCSKRDNFLFFCVKRENFTEFSSNPEIFLGFLRKT